MKHIAIVSSVLILICFMGVRTSTAEDFCFGCHERSDFKGRVTHKPIASNKCSVCHNPHVAKYKGLLHKKTEDLCYFCHRDEEQNFSRGIVHRPVQEGDCLACHQPHVSDTKGLLIEKNLTKSCLACHESLKEKYPVTHKPYSRGQCNICHSSHQSEHSELLKKDADSLCFSCHKGGSLSAKHKNFPKKLKGCLTCHNPHGSDRKGLVRNVLHAPYEDGCSDCHTGDTVATDVCLDCHDTVGEQLQTRHNHLTGRAGNNCILCHSPHAGDTDQLLRTRETKICRQCHQSTYDRAKYTKHKHPDSVECSNCHAVHGSNELAMLNGDGNAVCAECHETQGKFTHPVGEGVTDPRSWQPMTCVSCHYPHGTNFEFNLKLSGLKELCIQCHRGL